MNQPICNFCNNYSRKILIIVNISNLRFKIIDVWLKSISSMQFWLHHFRHRFKNIDRIFNWTTKYTLTLLHAFIYLRQHDIHITIFTRFEPQTWFNMTKLLHSSTPSDLQPDYLIWRPYGRCSQPGMRLLQNWWPLMMSLLGDQVKRTSPVMTVLLTYHKHCIRCCYYSVYTSPVHQ